MSVEAMVTAAEKLVKGEPIKFPAMSYRDWPLFTRCLQEAKAKADLR